MNPPQGSGLGRPASGVRGPLGQGIALLLLFVLILAGSARYLLASGWMADPVRFHVRASAAIDRLDFLAFDQDNNRFTAGRIEKTTWWTVHDIWVHLIVLQLPERDLAGLTQLEIQMGDAEPFTFPGEEVRSWVRRPPESLLPKELCTPGDVLVWVPNVFGKTSVFPWVRQAGASPWNWPGDAVYLRYIGQTALLPCAIVLMIVFLMHRCGTEPGRAWCSRVLTGKNEPPVVAVGSDKKAPVGLASLLVGLLLLGGVLTFLEVRQPYYFTQDDNLGDCLPMILVGCRSMWEGRFPEYNPYLFLGTPLASQGIYGLTYPPLPISYAIARHVFGQEYLTLEVFAILHLAAGLVLMRLLALRLGMAGLPANLVALSWVLAGTSLIMGRSWFNFMPIIIWLPTLFLGLERLVTDQSADRCVSWRWIAGMGLAAGVTFHVGLSQAAIYINSFLCLAVLFLLADGSLSWRRALAVVAALLIGAAIAMPLVYQQWLAAADVERFQVDNQGIALGLPALLLPYPLVQASLPIPTANVHVEYLGHLYFFGGLLAWLFFFQSTGWLYLVTTKQHKGTPGSAALSPVRQVTLSSSQVWTFCGLFALWLALGDGGGLWTIIARVPVIGFINRYPVRVMPFLVFFATISGGLVLDRMLRINESGRRTQTILAASAVALLLWHVAHCSTAFYTYGFRPYPELPPEMRAAFRHDGQPTGRVASWSRHRSADANYALLLPLNLPAVYDLPSWDGYNALVSGKKVMRDVYEKMQDDPAGSLRAYGIRWNLAHDPGRPPPISTGYSASWMLEVADRKLLLRKLPPEKLRVLYDQDGVEVRDRPNVDGLVFVAGEAERCLALTMHGEGLDVRLSPPAAAQRIVVNFQFYPLIKTTVDDQPVDCRPDEWNRIVLDVPAGSRELRVRYRPPWARGMLFGLGPLVLGVALGWALRRRGHSGSNR